MNLRAAPLAAVAMLCLSIVAAGCGSTGPAAVQLKALAGDYLAISEVANHQLDHEVDAYRHDERHSLAAARADLRAEVVTERWWDEHLLRIPFPPAIKSVARAVVRVNQARIALTERQARAGTLKAMVALDPRHKAADAQLEFAVRVIRRQLGLPPPKGS